MPVRLCRAGTSMPLREARTIFRICATGSVDRGADLAGVGFSTPALDRLRRVLALAASVGSTAMDAGGRPRRVFAAAVATGAGAVFGGRGVRVARIYADHRDPQLVYDPEHPDAGEDGFVSYPNIELAKEMTDMITALRSYEANTTAVNTAKSLYLKALEIGR